MFKVMPGMLVENHDCCLLNRSGVGPLVEGGEMGSPLSSYLEWRHARGLTLAGILLLDSSPHPFASSQPLTT